VQKFPREKCAKIAREVEDGRRSTEEETAPPPSYDGGRNLFEIPEGMRNVSSMRSPKEHTEPRSGGLAEGTEGSECSSASKNPIAGRT